MSFISEEKTQFEIQRLRQELQEEHSKCQRLQSQLSTNVSLVITDHCDRTSLLKAHVVSAFEQSLANMTSRLSQLTLTAEEKVSETPHI